MGKPARSTADVHTLRAWQGGRVATWGRLAVVVLSLGLVVALARVVQLKAAPDERLGSVVGTPFSSRPEPGRRGDLLDRRGRTIATTSLAYRLFIDPEFVEDARTIAVDIADLVGGDPIEIDREILEHPGSRYVIVRDLLEPWQIEAVRAAGMRGVGLETYPVRLRPGGEVAAGLVGRVGFEHTGQSGMEHRFEAKLLAERGKLTWLRDAGRRPLWIEPEGYTPPRDGGEVRLSIDLVIQEVVEEHVDRAVRKLNAGGGRMVVMDVRTGEILALYDALRARKGWTEQTEDPARAIDLSLGRNRCATDPYEPGSTFKPFVWSVATELGRANPDEVLPTPESGPWRTSYGRMIRDTHSYGPSTWRKVLVKSMNTGMAMVAERMRHREMQDVLRRFGFGERTSCGLPSESPGLVTPPEKWSAYTQSSVAFGHEVGVTVIQMARAFCAFARDGTIPMVRLTAVSGDDSAYRLERRAVSEATALLTRSALRDVMTDGTGRKAQSERYDLFGKSGTPQLPKKKGGGYHEDRYMPCFIAGAPYRDPRIVVLCVLDDPDKRIAHLGGETAGPVVRDVIDKTLEYLGVPADHEPAHGDLAAE